MSTLASLLSPVAILNAFAERRGITETSGIAFGGHVRDRFDIYAPTERRSSGHPVVVFFYGGGWEDGDRGMYRFVGTALAARGMVVAIPDYRVFPEVCFPAFLEDGARAVRWVRDNIAGFGGDPERLVLIGHSAGGQIAAMLALDGKWLDAVGIEGKAAIRGWAGLAGPYDFLPLHSEVLKIIFGPEPDRWKSQPINFVEADAPPALLIAGKCDNVVDPGNVARLAQRIRERGGHPEVRMYPLTGHATLVGAFARPLRILAPVLADTSAFVARVTSAPALPLPAKQVAK